MTGGSSLGSNVLVARDGQRAGLRYALERIDDEDGSLIVVSAALPVKTVLAVVDAVPAETPLQVVDCSGEMSADEASALSTDASVTVAGSDIPAVGEATVRALDDATSPAWLCLDAVSAIADRSSIQQTYKLLYLVAERVRERDAHAFYTWAGSVDAKTLRILGRPLDDVVRDGADDISVV